jgi:hypothetical protein
MVLVLAFSTSRTIASNTLFKWTNNLLATPFSSRTIDVTALASKGTPSFAREGCVGESGVV